MLARVTSKNQITLPKAVASRFADVEYFDVSTDGECVVLRPLRESRAEEVRSRLAELGIDEQDVADAMDWARKPA
ncbi:MAG: AbrB/MazE/SpoVT family DNA-binding domain-containing protein [Acidobacteriaceae bacterium]